MESLLLFGNRKLRYKLKIGNSETRNGNVWGSDLLFGTIRIQPRLDLRKKILVSGANPLYIDKS